MLQSKVIHGGSNSEISGMLTNSMAAPSGEAIVAAVNLLKGMNCLTRAGELTDGIGTPDPNPKYFVSWCF